VSAGSVGGFLSSVASAAPSGRSHKFLKKRSQTNYVIRRRTTGGGVRPTATARSAGGRAHGAGTDRTDLRAAGRPRDFSADLAAAQKRDMAPQAESQSQSW